MANPRQRRKRRSGSYKPVKQSVRAKKLLHKQPPIRGPKVLQDAWDKHKTVRQNYEALGLVVSLNPTESGGVERGLLGAGSRDPEADRATPPEGSTSSQKRPNDIKGILKGHGRIIRDGDGNIVDVELPEEESEAVAAEEGMEDVADPREDEEAARWIGLGTKGPSGLPKERGDETKGHVVRALEEMSRDREGCRRRFASGGEVAMLRRLVGRYGEDVERMARDRRLNGSQRTAGELRRAMRQAGGIGALRGVCDGV